MTTAAEQTEKAKQEQLKARNADMEKREKELNAAITGKGLRKFLGMTRGRNPQEIQYAGWDLSLVDSLPVTISEFAELRKDAVSDEAGLVRRLLLGDNELLYTEASDPVSEYVDLTWPEDIQKMFRQVVRNYSSAAGISIEDAVALVKPGIAASQSAKVETV